ncbi:MAG: type II secretion system minor pseudopilin GspI [Gammaproteobacteria bacterium]|nr:type II secretion system minor pseudopilin GspI [Gammaproteobacteria bacterium]
MNNKSGFTLIEVLVALAIVSIALTAVIKVSSQNIKNTFYIQEKTIALWVASDIINEMRLGVIKVPEKSEMIEEKKEMLNQSWPYTVNLSNTPNVNIKKIYVVVYTPREKKELIHLESYLYVQ